MSRSIEEALYGADLAPGALAGPYLIETIVHRGGVASLYRAREATSRRPIALKVLLPQYTAVGRLLERFEREAELLARLRHPQVVEVLEYGTLHDGRPFIAMEWLEGRNLAAELRARGPLTATEALAVAEQVGAALMAAHGLGILHRDLKSENVMALPDGAWFRVKLVDFGIAKLIGADAARHAALTSTGALLGTPSVMAPEQILRRPLDERTDIYALGVLLFQLLTGRLPFTGASAVEIEEQHLSMPAPRASELAPVAREVDAVIARCLEKQPARRHGSVGDVLADLRRAVARSAGAATVPAAVERAVGLLVDAPGPGIEDASGASADAALDAIEAVGRIALDASRAAGLDVALTFGNGLLAVAPLPADASRACAICRRVLEVGRSIASQVGCAITLHVASRTVQSDDDSRDACADAGDLLRLGRWPSRAGTGCFATAAALAVLEMPGAAVPGHDQLFRVDRE